MGLINWDWLAEQLGIPAIADSNNLLEQKIVSLEISVMTLAEKIKGLIAVETEEGKKLQEASAKLKEALDAANAKIAELEAKGVELESVKAELAEASLAADAIADINVSPIADGVVDEVKENPEIETPPVVDEAPETSPETIPAPEVVDAAVDAIDAAE